MLSLQAENADLELDSPLSQERCLVDSLCARNPIWSPVAHVDLISGDDADDILNLPKVSLLPLWR